MGNEEEGVVDSSFEEFGYEGRYREGRGVIESDEVIVNVVNIVVEEVEKVDDDGDESDWEDEEGEGEEDFKRR